MTMYGFVYIPTDGEYNKGWTRNIDVNAKEGTSVSYYGAYIVTKQSELSDEAKRKIEAKVAELQQQYEAKQLLIPQLLTPGKTFTLVSREENCLVFEVEGHHLSVWFDGNYYDESGDPFDKRGFEFSIIN